MLRQMVLFSGSSAVGKTTVLQSLLPLIRQSGGCPAVCKIDCLGTEDHKVYRAMGLPCVVGLSGDICPDHFLVSNLPELWNWTERIGNNMLFLETAGLCHRCSPATRQMVPSYFCARSSVPETVARRVAEGILCPKLCRFYAEQGDLILHPACADLSSRQEGDHYMVPSAHWLSSIAPEAFYEVYCRHIPTAKYPEAI